MNYAKRAAGIATILLLIIVIGIGIAKAKTRGGERQVGRVHAGLVDRNDLRAGSTHDLVDFNRRNPLDFNRRDLGDVRSGVDLQRERLTPDVEALDQQRPTVVVLNVASRVDVLLSRVLHGDVLAAGLLARPDADAAPLSLNV